MSCLRWRLAPALALLLALAGCAPAESSSGILVSRAVEIAPPSPQPAPTPAPPAAPPEARLLFVGDIMLARRPGEAVAGGADPFTDFADLLHGAAAAVGNLECVIATVGERVPKAYNFRCHPRNVPLLARYFQGVTVANNHSGDYGKEAFAEQLRLLKAGGMPYFGGGMDLAEAHTPLVLERNGLRIAYLGYNEVELRSFEAGATAPGLAWSVDEQVANDIAAARKRADVVVVFPHWGVEYRSEPTERQQALAHRMVEAGADLVVGAHPHVTETIEWYRDRLIVYSLGNFVFDDFVDVPERLGEPSRTSWVLAVTVRKGSIGDWRTWVARTDDQGIPRRVRSAKSPCGKDGTREISACAGD